MDNNLINSLLEQSPVAITVQGKNEITLTEAVHTDMAKAHVSRVRSFIKATLRDKAELACFLGHDDAQAQMAAYFKFKHQPR